LVWKETFVDALLPGIVS